MNETEALREVQRFYLYGAGTWAEIWDHLPQNIRTIVLKTFRLRFKFHRARTYLTESGAVRSSLQLPAFYNFQILVVLAIQSYGLSGCVAYVQSFIESYVLDGLDRNALITLAAWENVSGLV
jgi:hypothetical protein